MEVVGEYSHWTWKKIKKGGKKIGRGIKDGVVYAGNYNPTIASGIGYTRTKVAKYIHPWDFAASEIVESLFLGNIWDVGLKEDMKTLGITHILSVATGASPSFKNSFTYLHIDIRDVVEDDLLQHFESACKFIHEGLTSGGKVLVHCMQGRSRSSSCLIAYLIKHKDMSLEEALAHTKAQRDIVKPNEGFMEQLRTFESNLQKNSPDSPVKTNEI